MVGQERRVELGDGAATTLEAWGDGPIVLCIHGITSSRKSWERFGRHFAGRWRTYAYDQRGHGDSAAVEGPMTHARSIADARAVAAAIGEPIHAIVGHSWGGAIAILAGREIAAGSVVAVDPMLYVEPGSWRREYLDDAEADLALSPAERERVLRDRLQAWDELDIAGKLHAMRAMRARAIASLGSENRVDEGAWDLRPLLAGYPRPLLVASAAPGESVMSAGDLALLRAASPAIAVSEFADQGHNLHRTAFARFAAEAEDFVSARSARGAVP